MRILGVDLGERHTGIAFLDSDIGICMPIEVIHHKTTIELQEALFRLIESRSIQHIAFGLPLLPSGEEGHQASVVRQAIEELTLPDAISFSLIDERYTNDIKRGSSDHTDAACSILTVYQDRVKSS